MNKSLTILGSTGSVGGSTLEVIRNNREAFAIHALTANKNVALLASQAKEFNAKLAVIGDDTLLDDLKAALAGTDIKCAAGRTAVIAAAAERVDITMAAIVGMAGLEPILAAIKNGAHIAIANKEPLVAAGKFVIEAAQKSGAKILPVDSEHNAIFQVFENENRDKIRRIILTASGGPFRTWTAEQMARATPEQAVAHPNWSMGAKISVDSATMMNKALEVIEAHYLFDMPPEKIDVLVHPQSIVHSMVEYEDGSVLAQMGPTDMQVPIAHAISFPNRINNKSQQLDFTSLSGLAFEPVDERRFPAIKLAYDCIALGNASCIAFNAANEIAVAAFLEGRIGFTDIVDHVRRAVAACGNPVIADLNDVLEFDSKMRSLVQSYIMKNETTNRKVS